MELESVISRVRELHFSYEPLDGYGNYMTAQCYECRKKYPCATVQALDEYWNPLEHPVPRPESV